MFDEKSKVEKLHYDLNKNKIHYSLEISESKFLMSTYFCKCLAVKISLSTLDMESNHGQGKLHKTNVKEKKCETAITTSFPHKTDYCCTWSTQLLIQLHCANTAM